MAVGVDASAVFRQNTAKLSRCPGRAARVGGGESVYCRRPDLRPRYARMLATRVAAGVAGGSGRGVRLIPHPPGDSSMPTHLIPASAITEQVRQAPVHAVLIEFSRAAREGKILATDEFKKLAAYLLEQADGRDRREPWTSRPGVARPVPKLRVSVEKCFGAYADLHWFRLNKAVNASGQSLTGLFPRMAASLWRVANQDFAALVTALLSSAPDAMLLRYLNERGGKVRGIGAEAFSRLAFAYRRDLFFVFPRPWGDASGCLKYIGDDLRRYCGLCRNLRALSDELGLPPDIRGSIIDYLLRQKKPPVALLEALQKAIGPTLAKYSALEPTAAYEVKDGGDDETALPLEFAANAIRARRGRRELREALLRACGDRCTLTGNCPRDLLEIAYILPYPTGDVHAPSNAMLMRADVHTLWDLNLIGIEPRTGRIHIAPKLAGTGYEKLGGRKLLPRLDGTSVNPQALSERWRMFSGAHGSASDRPAGKGASQAPRGAEAAAEEAHAEVETVITRRSEQEQEAADR